MTATILDGWATAREIHEDLTERVTALRERGVVPGLGTLLVGDDPGSQSYVGMKHRDCAKVGIHSIDRRLPATATQAEVEAAVDELNADPGCHAYLVQLPLPKGLDEFQVLQRIDQAKDAADRQLRLSWSADLPPSNKIVAGTWTGASPAQAEVSVDTSWRDRFHLTLGDTLRFVHPRLLRPLIERGIGIETMDVRAACRTYNILMAEGRRVAAALLMESPTSAPT